MPGDVLSRLRDELQACHSKTPAPVAEACVRDVQEEAIGELARRDGAWIPLCSDYPNLKGVTCERVEVVIKQLATDKERDFLFESDGITVVDTESVESKITGLTDARVQELGVPPGMALDKYKDDLLARLGETVSTDLTQEEARRYLRNVKVYDRAEVYVAMERAAEERLPPSDRSANLYVTTPRGGHELLSILSYAANLSKGNIPSDIVSRGEKEAALYVHPADSGHSWLQHLLQELSNVPLEVPITFSNLRYSTWNDQRKKKHPYEANVLATMEEFLDNHIKRMLEPAEVRTWLGDRPIPSGDIYLVDDIIASGEQTLKAYSKLRQSFPDKLIHGIFLCQRKAGHGLPDVPVIDTDGTTIPVSQALYDDSFRDVDTTGLSGWKAKGMPHLDLRNEAITCAFPWSIPDGTSDQMLVTLYGGRVRAGRRNIDKQRDTPSDYEVALAPPTFDDDEETVRPTQVEMTEEDKGFY